LASIQQIGVGIMECDAAPSIYSFNLQRRSCQKQWLSIAR
jgi:hypothetical protein